MELWCALPWACDDNDCPHVWHLATYWATPEGVYYDELTDGCGDMDPVDEDDLPSQEQIDKAWAEYYDWCLIEGEDPLCELGVPTSVKENQSWEFRLGTCIADVTLLEAKRNGQTVERNQLPADVCSYLNLDDSRLLLQDFKDWQDVLRYLPQAKPGEWLRLEIEVNESRDPAVVSSEVREAAKRALKSQDH